MKSQRLVYPRAARQWMPPAPSLRRLAYVLNSLDVCVHPADLNDLHLTLLRSIESGTVEAAHATVEVLRRELTPYGMRLSRKQLQSVLATYLGSLPWDARLLQMDEEPVPVSVSEHPPITWWRDKVTPWARFVYRVTYKLEGFELAPADDNYGKAKVRRARILTRGTTGAPVVTEWKQQFLQAHPGHLSHVAYGREAAYLKASGEASPPAPLTLTHFIILEAELTGALDNLEGEPLMQRKLRKLHMSGLWSQVLGSGYQNPLRLIPVNEDDIPGFVDCQKVPGSKLEPWPLKSRGWLPLTRNRESFTAVMDLSKATGEWPKKRSQNEGVLTCERYGIVQTGSDAPRWLESILPRNTGPRHRASWQDVVQSAPFNEAVYSSKEGVLVTRGSGEVVRFAPWDTEKRHFCLDVNFSPEANALSAELAAQAHAEGKRVLVYADNENWSNFMNKLTPGNVICLSEASPFSLNPFSGITSEDEFQRLLPAFINIAYDLLGMTQNLASAALSKHFVSAWRLHGADLELKHVANQFRPFGKHDERALQAAIDHYVEAAGPWASGRAAETLKPGITCFDAWKLTASYEVRYVLGPIVAQLITALAYRNAVTADQRGENGSLTLLAPNYLNGSRYRAEQLMEHFAQARGSIGLFGKSFYGPESGLLQAFRADRSGIPRLCVGLTRNSGRPGLCPTAVQTLPSAEDARPDTITLAVLQADQALAAVTLEGPRWKV